jgi:Dehydrogenases with different specificities (related to short-chain alcohol dehydrogenases)
LTAAGIPVTFCRADITVEADVQRAIDGVVARHGTVDVLVNNAGVNAYYDATEMTEAEWNRVFDVDLKGAWLCAKYALQPMKRAAEGRSSTSRRFTRRSRSPACFRMRRPRPAFSD